MKAFLVTLREFLWTVIAVLAAGALAAAVLIPAQFADRSARVFEALQDEGFDVRIKTPLLEADFTRVTQEIADSDSRVIFLEERLAEMQAQNNSLWTAIDAAAEAGFDVEIDVPVSEMQEGEGEPSASTPPWVVIAGTQRSLDGQRAQLGLLQAAGIEDAVILQVDGWFQTAVVYDGGRAAAEAGLARVSEVVGANRGAYVRALDRICPSHEETPGDPNLWRCET
ncbi:hypothetical protein ACVDG3_09280 [Meridianimarinicoccus sp. RP-17]|uniref:hypothetical protein n=1 Tax=Meridianimarinicoccus zhengii TaxID=2056810 RepID=UPI000DACB9EB|nr:hypothetical protein [Phycocomes zhengii]